MKLFFRFILIILSSLFFQSVVYCSGKSSKGTAVGEFLLLGAGASSVSLGEAFSAVADDATSLYWNVGSLTKIKSKSLTVMHGLYFDSSYFDYLSYGQSFKHFGSIGVSYQYFTAGNIDQTDINGNTSGSFKPSDQAFTVGYAHKLAGFGIGFSLKSITSKIVHSASTLSGDIGVVTPAFLDDKLSLAATGKNLFGDLQYDEQSSELPREYRLGSAYKISDSWMTSLDVVFPKDEEIYEAIGTEYRIGRTNGMQVAGRAGYNSQTNGDVEGFTGFGFGMGLVMRKMSLDYGIVPFASLGLAHRFSLTFNF